METLVTIAMAAKDNGWRALLVGGAVRDMIMGKEPKDLDVEVYGCAPDELKNFLMVISDNGDVDAVGASFGVLKCRINGQDFDFSCPRRENKSGSGHKGFLVEFDPSITPKEAAARRDFTWNALAYDPLTDEVLDFFGGISDLRDGIIRHTSAAFAEDPLRVLRGMQFAGRFGMTCENETRNLCKSLIEEYSTLAKERIWGEWLKWAEKSAKPSAGLRFLVDTGWIALYPELESMIGLPQQKEYHPEGDVWNHMLQTVDAAVNICNREKITETQRAVLVFAALCHDMGKSTTTEVHDDGRITSYGHDEACGPFAESFLRSIGAPEEIIEKVVRLVVEHMAHLQPASERSVKRLANRLHPATIAEWAVVVESDHSGRHPIPGGIPVSAVEYVKISEELSIKNNKPAPVLMGRHLIAAGMKPGVEFGEVLRAAYEAQLDGTLTEFCKKIGVSI